MCGMAEQMNARTWVCERDDNEPDSPFCAKLLIGEEVIASGRGVDEVAAYGALVAALDRQGIRDGNVLGMHDLMRR
jgi:hypothetical protein